ncbi:MAG: N-6 DNA methylase [Gemmatimonadales bacterium]
MRRVETVENLPDLFKVLGYEPQLLPFDDAASTVARWKGFRVVAVQSSDPAPAARALARTIGRLGERGLAVSLGQGRLCLAAPHIGKAATTKAYAIQLEEPTREHLDFVEALRPDTEANALSHAIRISELLRTEAAGDRFFRAFRQLLDEMVASLDNRCRLSDRRQVTLLALTRILFLYFVQAKGWLNGDRRFLRKQLDRALAVGESFHSAILDELFFGTLNQPLAKRRTSRFNDIPYLNGGLFEMHSVERRMPHRHFANEIWCRAFDDVFERFRFCVREADEVDAIAPDMLGRVFERLMATQQRLTSGTFYTPEELVRHVVTTAIDKAALEDGSHCHSLMVLLRSGKPDRGKLRRRLRELRILDPACGSGAFLLGALDHLTALWVQLSPDKPVNRSRLRRHLLEQNLFGVDLDPTAIRLAELRLWLAIIADDPETTIDKIAPLPNLDGIVRQGDTLMDPVSATRAFVSVDLVSASPEARGIENCRRRLFDARGSKYRKLTRELRHREADLANRLLKRSSLACAAQLRELDALQATPDLFGVTRPLTTEQQRMRNGLVSSVKHLKRSQKAVSENQIPFFAFEVHAPRAMARGGFDVVIGNPPWVRAERLSKEARVSLKRRFRWWQATGRRGYAHLPDLSLAFVERGLELTRPNGVMALVVPSKVTSSGYGEPARQTLVRETTLEYLHRVPEHQSKQFGATTYPLVIILRRSTPPPRHRVRLSFETKATVRQSSLRRTGPWILRPDHDLRAIGDFLESAPPLSAMTRSALGVKTGADGVFVGTPIQRRGKLTLVQFATSEVWTEVHVLRPVVRGRDVRPFGLSTVKVILWACDREGVPLEAIPELAHVYIAANASALRARADYNGGPLWAVFRTGSACAAHRVVWPDIARYPRAVYLEAASSQAVLPLNTCYCAATPSGRDAHIVTAVLNSTWVIPYVRSAADEARGGYRRLNARVMDRIPIPADSARLTSAISISKRAHAQQHVEQNELDEVVAEALDISTATQARLRTMALSERN